MKFEEWLNEAEGFSLKIERVVEDILIHDYPYEKKYKNLIKWLETAYKIGFEEAKQSLVSNNFENLNETLSEKQLNKMIAETIWMADRPRTWKEWFDWNFCRKFF